MLALSADEIALVTAIGSALSATAVTISSIVLYLTHIYNKRLSRARIAPVETSVSVSILGSSLQFTLSVQFKNVGLDEAMKLSAEAFALDLASDTTFGNPQLDFPSPLYKEQDFVLPVNFTVPMGRELTAEEAHAYAHNFESRYGTLIIAIVMSYATASSSSWLRQGREEQRFLFEYSGGAKLGICPKHRFEPYRNEFPRRFQV